MTMGDRCDERKSSCMSEFAAETENIRFDVVKIVLVLTRTIAGERETVGSRADDPATDHIS